MKFYLETLPKKLNLTLLNKGTKKTKYLLITEEGIIEHSNKNYKRIYNDSVVKYYDFPTSNIKIVEDASSYKLVECFNIPLDHTLLKIEEETIYINKMKMIIEKINNKLYDIYFYANSIEEIKKNIDTLNLIIS